MGFIEGTAQGTVKRYILNCVSGIDLTEKARLSTFTGSA
jgi:hypothetical protein